MGIVSRQDKVIGTISTAVCGCSDAIPGKMSLNLKDHSNPDCWVRRRILSKRYTVDTSILPAGGYTDGVRLGVAIG